MRTLTATLVLAAVLAACGGTASGSPTTPQSQVGYASASPAAHRIVCGTVPQATCEAIVAQVIRSVPDMAASPLVVVDFGGDEVTAHYGGDTPGLGAFKPVGKEDLWMNPPTWGPEDQQGGAFVMTQEWRLDSLPAAFVAQALARRRGPSDWWAAAAPPPPHAARRDVAQRRGDGAASPRSRTCAGRPNAGSPASPCPRTGEALRSEPPLHPE